MRCHCATERHRHCANSKGNGCDTGESGSANVLIRQLLKRENEEQIDRAEAEEGNVTETIQTPLAASVAAQPILAMEIQSEDHARDESEQHPEPGQGDIHVEFAEAKNCSHAYSYIAGAVGGVN